MEGSGQRKLKKKRGSKINSLSNKVYMYMYMYLCMCTYSTI